jgi:hypothetical protein
MESSIESVLGILKRWRAEKVPLHCRFVNNWEGWEFRGAGLLQEAELIDESLKLGFEGWTLEFSVKKFRRVSVTDPRVLPDGVSLPISAQSEVVAYVSEKFVSIEVSEHSYFFFSDVLDSDSFARA